MLPLNERVFLYTYLSTLIQQPVTYRDAIKMYYEDARLSARHKKSLEKALFLFSKKQTLGEALYEQNLIPHEEYIILKQLKKEVAGDARLLRALSRALSYRAMEKRAIKNLIIYPTILLIELCFVIVLGIFWVVPQLYLLFSKTNVEFPDTFILLYKINVLLRQIFTLNTLPFFIIGTGIALLLYHAKILEPTFWRLRAELVKLWPIAGFYRLKEAASLFTTLSLLGRQANSSLTANIKTATLTIKNPEYKKALGALADHLKEGGTWKQFFEDKHYKDLFPPITRRLMILSERNNIVEKQIYSLHSILSKEYSIAFKNFIKILEPLIILIIAGFVLGFALILQQMLAQAQQAVFSG